MKHLTRIIRMASVMVLLTIAACKKNSNETKPEPKPITAEELLGYQLIALLRSPEVNDPARLFHFAKSGDAITATMDGVTSRRVWPIKLTDNRFTFDSNGDGKIIYEFNLKRDDKGLVVMDSYKYQNLNDPTIILTSALIWQSDFPSFKGKTFVGINGNPNTLKFINDTWTLTPAINGAGTYYEIAKGAWKGRLNGVDYMGFSGYIGNLLAMGLVKYGSAELSEFGLKP